MTFPQTPNDVDIELYYDAGWQNINQYVYHRDMNPITITRGRTAEGRNCDPGVMTLTLNNRDGRFSPRNPSSALFGKIGRNTPIRVSVTYNAVTYVRFVGEITSWPSRWDVSGKDVWVPVEAAGILRRLSQGSKPIKPPLDLAIQGDAPVHYWRMDDPADSTFARSSMPNGTVPINAIGTIAFGALASPPGGDGEVSAPDFTGAAGVSEALAVAAPWTVEWSVMRPDDGSIDGGQIFQVGYMAAGAEEFLSAAISEDTAVSARDWYHFMIQGTQNGGNWEIHWWKNGIAQGLADSGAGTLGNVIYVRPGGSPAVSPSPHSVAFIAVYDHTSVDAQDHSDALQAYVDMQAHERFELLCTQAGIPFETVGSSSQEMSAQRPVTLLQSLRDAEATDQGFLYERRDALGLAFRTNSSRYNQIPIQLDYGEGHISPPFDPEPDDRNVANDREVKSRTGAKARRELPSGPLSVQDPPDGVGRYDDTITVDVFDDDQLEHIAGWRVHVGTWDAERYPRVRVDLSAASNTSLIPQIAAADSGDLITIDNLPAWLPPETAELLIEGYREVIGFYDWDFIFNTSPAGPYNVVGVWGLVGKELHAAIDSSTTSADIATTSGPLLSTTVTGGGYSATIGLEEVQVTAVAASTVTFGAAGTVAHANNASVTPGIPASVATGNLLLVFAAIRNSGTGVPDTPSGYTRLAAFGSSDNCQLFAKIATSGAEAAPTITFTGGVAGADTSAQMIRLAGKWHSASNVLLDSTTQLNASAQNINYPGLMVPMADDCIILYLGWKQDDWTSVTGPGTEIGEPDTTTGDDQGIAWYYAIQTTATAVGTGAFTVTGGAAAISRSAVVALRCDYQTATITRSINGVTASHSAADAVTLTRPSRWALV